jgi:ATP-dependent Lon protease
LRGGIKTVLIPGENEKDLVEIPDNVKKNLTIIPVETVDDVLKHALTKPIVAIEWDESEQDKKSVSSSSGDEGDSDGVVTH